MNVILLTEIKILVYACPSETDSVQLIQGNVTTFIKHPNTSKCCFSVMVCHHKTILTNAGFCMMIITTDFMFLALFYLQDYSLPILNSSQINSFLCLTLN